MTDRDDPATFTEPAFLARLRARDAGAVESVVHAYLGQILRAARGAGLDDQQARDLTQTVFLAFVQGIDRFEGRSHVRTWLFGILYRKLAETRRGLQRDGGTDDIDQVVESRFAADGTWVRPPAAADRDLLDEEIRARLDACLGEVPERQRLVFVLREVEGLETEEICKITDVSRTNLGVLLFRVRNRLRECLEKFGLKG